jgi:hypothetical protein
MRPFTYANDRGVLPGFHENLASAYDKQIRGIFEDVPPSYDPLRDQFDTTNGGSFGKTTNFLTAP